MALPNLYSRRKRISSGDIPDVYTHDEIPLNLRRSVFMIMDRTVHGMFGDHNPVWQEVSAVLQEELGVRVLTEKRPIKSASDEVESFFINADIEHVLDTIELWFHFAYVSYRASRAASFKDLGDARDRINARLHENGIGFELSGSQVMEKSTEFTHVEMTVPALRVLSEKRFAGANEEFRKAHDAYKVGDYKDCISNCLKAFESVMKSIADEQKWGLDPNATAKALINALLDNDYIPAFMQTQFGSLRTFLESGIPTVRNKTSGHGQGAEPVEVPKALAAYQLHQTAAAIVFLAEL